MPNAATKIIVSGTPTESGTFSFSYKLTDAANASETLSDTIKIEEPIVPLSITGDAPDTEKGDNYYYQYGIDGGEPPYSVSLDSGTLPPGITLSSAGTLTGNTSTTDTYSFAIKAVDAKSNTDIVSDSIAVTTIAITGNAPNAAENELYSYQYTAIGTGPFIWSIASGSLPDGITLDTANGVISGVLSNSGTFNWAMKIENTSGDTATQTDTAVIAEYILPPSVTGNLPDWLAYIPLTYQYNAAYGTPPYTFSISSGALPTGLTLNYNTGEVTGVPTAIGNYSWTVKVVDSDSKFSALSDSSVISLQTDDGVLLGNGSTAYEAQGNLYVSAIALKSNGSVATGFNYSIVSQLNSGFARQGTNKIIVTGGTEQVDGTMYYGMARIYTTGAVDNTFSPSYVGSNYYALSPIIDNNNNIFVITSTPTLGYSIVKLSPNGNVDESFNPIAFDRPNAFFWRLRKLALDYQGKILVAGNFTRADGVACNGIARLNSDGSLDNSFLVPRPTNINPSSPRAPTEIRVDDMAIDHSTGDVYLLWKIEQNAVRTLAKITKYASDGSIISDPFIRNDSAITLRSPGTIAGMFLHNNMLYMYGDSVKLNGYDTSQVSRSNLSGDIDTTYTPSFTELNSSRVNIRGAIMQDNGKLVAAGTFEGRVTRFNPDGSDDLSFNPSISISGYINYYSTTTMLLL